MDAALTAIRQRLSRLERSAGARGVFGSQVHGFRVRPPLSEKVVEEFEIRHRISLPTDYRSFLIHVGNGGAGPFYGLFGLGEMDDRRDGYKPWTENDGFIGVLSEPFPHADPWNDLTGEPVYDEARAEDDADYEDEFGQRLEDWQIQNYWNSQHVNGAIPICHLGCAILHLLVVTGPEKGNVWEDDRANRHGLTPLQSSGQARMTFLRWYVSWLDDALRQL